MTDDGYAAVGRELLAAALQEHADDLQTALYQASRAAQDGDVAAADVRRVENALDALEPTLDHLAAVSAYDRPLALRDLDADQLEAVL